MVHVNSLKNLKLFEKGNNANPGGRPKQVLARVDVMCFKDDKHPYTELMKLLPSLKPREQAEIWLQILSYCQSKPKSEDIDYQDTTREELKKLSINELVTLVKTKLPEDALA